MGASPLGKANLISRRRVAVGSASGGSVKRKLRREPCAASAAALEELIDVHVGNAKSRQPFAHLREHHGRFGLFHRHDDAQLHWFSSWSKR